MPGKAHHRGCFPAIFRLFSEVDWTTLDPSITATCVSAIVMSFRPAKGFKRPKDGKPAFKQESFNKEINPVKLGDAKHLNTDKPEKYEVRKGTQY